jgi:hypothetical protein
MQRPSISSVDARVARLEEAQQRLEARQLEQAGAMSLITQEQKHLREIVDARFTSIESGLQVLTGKFDTFVGRMEALIDKGMEQQGDLKASPLGRQIDERLIKTEQWVEVSKEFHAEQRGQRKLITALVGGNVLSVAAAAFALAKAVGWIQ